MNKNSIGLNSPVFFSQELDSSSDSLTLEHAESHHALNVLRLRYGDLVIIKNGKGLSVSGEIIEKKPFCKVRVVGEKIVKPFDPLLMELCIVIPKSKDRWRFLLEKFTELGGCYLQPIFSDFSEKKSYSLTKQNQYIVGALKQSGRFWLPEIKKVIGIEDFLKKNIKTEKFIAHNYSQKKSVFLKQIKFLKQKNYTFLVGPEGGFSEREIKLAEDKGYQFLYFGNNTLRTETAGIHITSYFNTCLYE